VRGQAPPAVELQGGVRDELPLDLGEERYLVDLIALDRRDDAPRGRETSQVLDRVLAGIEVARFPRVFPRCARRHRAPAESPGQAQSERELPVLGADELPAPLER